MDGHMEEVRVGRGHLVAKITIIGWALVLMPVILTTQEAEIRRMAV
jgi:hypothetical protein